MIKQRRMIANYLDVADTGAEKQEWAFMGAGFKSLEENPTAQTKSRKYICDKSTTQSINGYSWSTPFELDQIREKEAVDFICKIGELQLVGADTERDFLMVELTKPIKATYKIFCR